MVCLCVCVCAIRLTCLRVVPVELCVVLYGVLCFVCDCCVFVCVFFHVFVGVVCDLLCGDVWAGFVCVVLVCVCSLF